jgi:hypothetical protein
MSPRANYGIARWKNGRFWSLSDQEGNLVCVCVYKRGASEVTRLLEERGEYPTGYAGGKEGIRETAD